MAIFVRLTPLTLIVEVAAEQMPPWSEADTCARFELLVAETQKFTIAYDITAITPSATACPHHRT